jgi:hypothetical protein
MSTVETTTEIRSFRVGIPEDDLAELRRRIAATCLPEKETVAYQSQAGALHHRGASRDQATANERGNHE